MSQSKVTISKVDGKEVAVATLTVDLGEVTDERKLEENVVAVGMGVDALEELYKQILFERAEKVTFEEFKELLEQYMSFRMHKLLGVSNTPIKRNKKGVIEGLHKFVELVDESKGK